MLPDEPTTRLETYLARLAGQDVTIPETPITRVECYLDYMIRNGGGVPAGNAGAHNSIFRGKNLGSTYTAAQANAIDGGTFDDLFIGDYWEMPWGESETSVKFRIAGFDYFYLLGGALASQYNLKHHVVVVPDVSLGTSAMYEDGATIEGYVGSIIKTTVLPGMLTAISNLFGENSLISIWTSLTTSNQASIGFYASSIDLLSMTMLFGITIYTSMSPTHDKQAQLPLFALANQYTRVDNEYYYMQDMVVSNNDFYVVPPRGLGFPSGKSQERGVRPYFCIGKVTPP